MDKFYAMIYGVLSYLLFLLTILYTIGFLYNIFVPKSIDSGSESSFIEAFVINGSLLCVFAAQHSFMARTSPKSWLSNLIYPTLERSTYVLFSSVALILIFWYWHPIKLIIWKIENDKLHGIITAFYFLGWCIVFASPFMISLKKFFGLQQVMVTLDGRATVASRISINYLYEIVRHPAMLGFIIVIWATPVMTFGHLLLSLCMTLYIFVLVKFLKEKDHHEAVGKDYESCHENVAAFLPFRNGG